MNRHFHSSTGTMFLKPLWHCRKDAASKDPMREDWDPTKPVKPAQRPENFLAQPFKRTRSKSKREKDTARLDFRLERQRLFKEAFHDNIHSKGEVDALTGSEPLSVDRGDVLRDPKIKGYQHPALGVKWEYADPKRDRHKSLRRSFLEKTSGVPLGASRLS